MDKNDELLMDGIDDRIETFLRGEMSTEEEAAFKQEIRLNPELRNRAMAMTSLIKGLHDQNTVKEKAILNGNTAKSRVRPILLWATSIAAVFAILFGIYKDQRYRTLDATVTPYYTEYSMSDVSRGDVDSVAATHIYGLFTQIQNNRSMSDVITELEPIYRSLDDDFTYHPWATDIAWYLALAYIKDDQIDKAILILKKLKEDNPETPIYNKADDLIKKLTNL